MVLERREAEGTFLVREAGDPLEARRAEADTHVNLTRQADHLLATANWNGASVVRRASKLEAFEEAPYLAESLDRTGHDRLFAQALEKAVALIGDGTRGKHTALLKKHQQPSLRRKKSPLLSRKRKRIR